MFNFLVCQISALLLGIAAGCAVYAAYLLARYVVGALISIAGILLHGLSQIFTALLQLRPGYILPRFQYILDVVGTFFYFKAHHDFQTAWQYACRVSLAFYNFRVNNINLTQNEPWITRNENYRRAYNAKFRLIKMFPQYCNHIIDIIDHYIVITALPYTNEQFLSFIRLACRFHKLDDLRNAITLFELAGYGPYQIREPIIQLHAIVRTRVQGGLGLPNDYIFNMAQEVLLQRQPPNYHRQPEQPRAPQLPPRAPVVIDRGQNQLITHGYRRRSAASPHPANLSTAFFENDWRNFLRTLPEPYNNSPSFSFLLRRVYNEFLETDALKAVFWNHFNEVKFLLGPTTGRPDFLRWIDARSAIAVAGCENQPLTGFIEICAWLQIASQPTTASQIRAAFYLKLYKDITAQVMSRPLEIPAVYHPEVVYALLKDVYDDLLRTGAVSPAQSWLGIYNHTTHVGFNWGQPFGNLSVEQWMQRPAIIQLRNQLKAQVRSYTFEELKQTVINSSVDFNMWADIAYPHERQLVIQATADERDFYCPQGYNMALGDSSYQEALAEIPAEKHRAFWEFLGRYVFHPRAIDRLEAHIRVTLDPRERDHFAPAAIAYIQNGSYTPMEQDDYMLFADFFKRLAVREEYMSEGTPGSPPSPIAQRRVQITDSLEFVIWERVAAQTEQDFPVIRPQHVP